MSDNVQDESRDQIDTADRHKRSAWVSGRRQLVLIVTIRLACLSVFFNPSPRMQTALGFGRLS